MNLKKTRKLLLHLLLFIFVELLFTLLIFHELPSISLINTIGIIHLLYFVLIIIAGWLRELSQHIWQRFLCTYIPILIHVIGHIWVMELLVEEVIDHNHSIVWTIITALVAGLLIVFGEWLLHRKEHCDHYHQKIHKHCL